MAAHKILLSFPFPFYHYNRYIRLLGNAILDNDYLLHCLHAKSHIKS